MATTGGLSDPNSLPDVGSLPMKEAAGSFATKPAFPFITTTTTTATTSSASSSSSVSAEDQDRDRADDEQEQEQERDSSDYGRERTRPGYRSAETITTSTEFVEADAMLLPDALDQAPAPSLAPLVAMSAAAAAPSSEKATIVAVSDAAAAAATATTVTVEDERAAKMLALKRSQTEKPDPVRFSTFAPPEADVKEAFVVQVWAYMKEQRRAMLQEALRSEAKQEKAVERSSIDVWRNTQLLIKLHLHKDLSSEEPREQNRRCIERPLIWLGDKCSVFFRLRCQSTTATLGDKLCRTEVWIGQQARVVMWFNVRIGEKAVLDFDPEDVWQAALDSALKSHASVRLPAAERTRPPPIQKAPSLARSISYMSRVLACYAAADADRVQSWVDQAKANNPGLDIELGYAESMRSKGERQSVWRHMLHSGQVWKRFHMLLVFWSENAVLEIERRQEADKDAVTLATEWHMALTFAETGYPHYVQPVPLDPIPLPKALAQAISVTASVDSDEEAPEQLKVDLDELHGTDELLGYGQFGEVYLGYYNGEKVVVKNIDLSEFHQKEEIANIFSEVAILKRLAKHQQEMKQSYIVGFRGAVVDGDTLKLVMELCERGSLRTMLDQSFSAIRPRPSSPSEQQEEEKQGGTAAGGAVSLLPLNERIRLARDAAAAVSELHGLKMIHRDIAARNFLVTKTGQVKIADFGLCLLNRFQSFNVHLIAEQLPFKWMAPESIRQRMFSEQSDVWSLGCTFIEIFTGEKPNAHEANFEERQIEQAFAPSLPKGHDVPLEIQQLLNRMWSLNPAQRPSAAAVYEELNRLPCR